MIMRLQIDSQANDGSAVSILNTSNHWHKIIANYKGVVFMQGPAYTTKFMHDRQMNTMSTCEAHVY